MGLKFKPLGPDPFGHMILENLKIDTSQGTEEG